jgi:CheY-like chemotaxis protein
MRSAEGARDRPTELILVVEDEKNERTALVELLRLQGYE